VEKGKRRSTQPRPPQSRRVQASLSGPVLYCTGCGRRVGTYGSPRGQGTPKPGGLCPACRKRREATQPPRPPGTAKRLIPANPRPKKVSSRPIKRGHCGRCLKLKDNMVHRDSRGYGVCADCKAMQLPPVERAERVSMRASSAGLPTLGKRR
jgi:hypothetical protein